MGSNKQLGLHNTGLCQTNMVGCFCLFVFCFESITKLVDKGKMVDILRFCYFKNVFYEILLSTLIKVSMDRN